MTQETKANQGKGAIFDLDGTLLDSMGVWDQVDVDFLAKRGIEVPDELVTHVAPPGLGAYWPHRRLSLERNRQTP